MVGLQWFAWAWGWPSQIIEADKEGAGQWPLCSHVRAAELCWLTAQALLEAKTSKKVYNHMCERRCQERIYDHADSSARAIGISFVAAVRRVAFRRITKEQSLLKEKLLLMEALDACSVVPLYPSPCQLSVRLMATGRCIFSARLPSRRERHRIV